MPIPGKKVTKTKTKRKRKVFDQEGTGPRCVACEGTGHNTQGGLCWPCEGTGQNIWTCPSCRTTHRGFRRNECRIETCKDYAL